MATLILGLVSADRQDDVRLDLKGIRRIRRGREPGALGESLAPSPRACASTTTTISTVGSLRKASTEQ
jgi:hypothetical protein